MRPFKKRIRFKDARVIELGAGCGLPGLLMGHFKAKQVVLTDIAQCVELLNENIEGNKLEANVTAAALNWTSPVDAKLITEKFGRDFDYILAADTVYHPDLVLPFYNLLKHFSGDKTKILFSAPRPRVQEATNAFFNLVHSDLFFEIEKVAPSRFIPDLKLSSAQFTRENEGLFILSRRVSAS